MNFNKTRFAAGLLSIAMLISALDMTVYAVEIDKLLPVAGLDLSLNEGVSMKSVAEEQGLDTETVIVEPAEVVKNDMLEEMKEDYSNLVIADVNDYVNIRSLPSEEGEIVGKLYDNSVGEFIEEEDGWYKIESGNCTGYVKAEYCIIGEAASKLAKEMMAEGKDFVAAESKEEEAARLAEEKKKREAQQKKAVTKTTVTTEIAENGLAVADFACQFIGNPYKWGGTSLTDGADCSGFVMSVYANFGVELPHSSSALRKVGYDVGSLSDAIAGDIICYSGHVGIYIGDGRIVHASTKKTGIIVSNADYKTILKIRRIF